jgi:4-hydroxy-tetrahydrodipicolinate synthase
MKEEAKMGFYGIYPVMITPMTDGGEIDFAGFAKNIEYYLQNGVHGVIALGSTGEFVSLSEEERIRVAEFVVSEVAGRVNVIIGTAAETTRDTLKFTQHAQAIGADGAMIINPYYYKPSEQELYEHYRTICENTDIDIMLYNNPGVTGINLSNELLLRLAKEFPRITTIKESSGDIRKLRDLTLAGRGFVETFCGFEDLVLESYFVGARGWVSVAGNLIPKLSVAMFQSAIEEGDWDKAWQEYEKALPLLAFLENSGKLVQAVKRGMELIGLYGGVARAPRAPLTKSQEEELIVALRTAGLTVHER